MNRKKKINQVLKAKVKKMNAKQQKTNKPKYISKAERAAIAEKEAEENTTESSTVEASSEPSLDVTSTEN
jgi:hypothetical protein